MDVRFKMKIPRYRLVLLTVFVAALLFFLVQMRILPGKSQRGAWPKGFQLVDVLMDLIRNDYLEERDPVQTAEGAYRGIVNSLDPLSSYLNKDLTARYAARSGRDTGPGFIVFKRYGAFPLVVGVVPGSPGDKAEVKLGDLVSAIGHRSTLSMSLTEVNLLLGGTDEKPVQLKLLRGNESRELSLPRARLYPRAWAFSSAPGHPAILTIHDLSGPLVAEIRKSVLPALKGKKKALILDLRDCAGGELEEALAFTNLFVRAAAVGVIEKRGGVKEPIACPAEATLGAIPVAIWAGPATIGPAEFVVGILQEVRKSKFLGLSTPGVVARTESFSLKDESSIILVTGFFSLPSGRSLWGQGLNPDITIPVTDQSDKAYLEKTLPLLPKL
jgi:carboxyl-terminal processing protease